MARWGRKIPDTSLEELQEKLGEIDDDGKAVKRLFTAIAYKQGNSPAEIEATYGISSKKVYQWLDRIEERGLDDALYDKPKPGRPPKLTEAEFDQLRSVLQESPRNQGYDAEDWNPRIVHHWLNATFDVDYSLRHIRRLMDDANHP